MVTWWLEGPAVVTARSWMAAEIVVAARSAISVHPYVALL